MTYLSSLGTPNRNGGRLLAAVQQTISAGRSKRRQRRRKRSDVRLNRASAACWGGRRRWRRVLAGVWGCHDYYTTSTRTGDTLEAIMSCSFLNPPLPVEEPVLAERRVLLAAGYSELNASVHSAVWVTHIQHLVLISLLISVIWLWCYIINNICRDFY